MSVSYEDLAERIFFEGITAQELLSIAKYRPHKSFSDIEKAVNQGRLEGLGNANAEFSYIARRLSEVVEIDSGDALG